MNLRIEGNSKYPLMMANSKTPSDIHANFLKLMFGFMMTSPKFSLNFKLR
jgi:hypothetical protein